MSLILKIFSKILIFGIFKKRPIFLLEQTMTTTNLIEKRRKNIEQRKNKLKQLEVSLNAQERKKRTRRLIEIGGLAEKANIKDWSANTLLGAFLSIKESESNKKQMDAWAHKGGIAFSSEKIQKSPVIVKFETQPSEEVRASLKSLGLKWNALRKEWEGYTKVSELKTVLASHQATIQELEISSEG